MQEFIQAFILIFIAEMGDKTQILAMAFATKYPVKKVILGVFIGSLLNHGLAIALGSQLTRIIPMETIQIIAGFAFIIFGIWSIRMEGDDDDENVGAKYGAIVTVALAFFIGELGDKTQLAAITLSVDSANLYFTLMGTVAGMVATSIIGIFIGKKIGDKVPEISIKMVAAFVFLAFGTQKLYSSVPQLYLTIPYILGYILMLGSIFGVLVYKNYQRLQSGYRSSYKETAKKLQLYYLHMERKVNTLCHGENACGNCQGQRCPIGNTKAILKKAINQTNEDIGEIDMNITNTKEFEAAPVNDIVKVTEKLRKSLAKSEQGSLEQILNNMRKIKKK